MRALALMLCVGCAGAAPRPAGKLDGRGFAELRALLDRRVQEGTFSGAVSVAAGDETVFSYAGGVADRATGAPIGPETKFNLASATKPITATAVLTLVAAGNLALDAPVGKLLPQLPPQLASLTPHQLLAHTAGLGDVIRSREFRKNPEAFASIADYLQAILAEPVEAPGQFRYAENDFVVLGALVEKVAGQPFWEYVRAHVLEPAGMGDTTWKLRPPPPGVAVGHTRRDLGGPAYAQGGTKLHANSAIFPIVAAPGAALVSTAPDLIRFARALHANRLLPQALRDRMWSPQAPTGQGADNPANASYGYGFFVGTANGEPIVNHGGTGPGIDVGFDLYPRLGVTTVVLANLDQPAAQEIRAWLRDHVAGGEMKPAGK